MHVANVGNDHNYGVGTRETERGHALEGSPHRRAGGGSGPFKNDAATVVAAAVACGRARARRWSRLWSCGARGSHRCLVVASVARLLVTLSI